ncbi:MAG TPA: hypothetical protein VGD80_11655 [Kofleriaceae bacterium]
MLKLRTDCLGTAQDYERVLKTRNTVLRADEREAAPAGFSSTRIARERERSGGGLAATMGARFSSVAASRRRA